MSPHYLWRFLSWVSQTFPFEHCRSKHIKLAAVYETTFHNSSEIPLVLQYLCRRTRALYCRSFKKGSW